MNIEVAIIDFLIEKLGTDSVYGEVPESPELEYYVVDKTGSSTTDRITTSMITIQSYAPSKYKASEMNENLKIAMDDVTTLQSVGGCHLISDYNFTNIEKKQNRYQAVYDITHY